MNDTSTLKIFKSDQEWRAQLTPEQYRITRQHGTERAFSSPDFDLSKKGVYHCVCCNRPLYRSQAKFDSGTGWPSFYEPISPERRDQTSRHVLWNEPARKSAAPIATRISATSSPTARRRQACATA